MKLATVVFAVLSSLAAVKAMWPFPESKSGVEAKKDDQAKIFGSCNDEECAKATEEHADAAEEKKCDESTSCCDDEGVNPPADETAKFMGMWDSKDNKQEFGGEDEE